MMLYNPWSVVDVPFPFIDKGFSKKRKALVISSDEYQKQTSACILVMITSAENSFWSDDVILEYFQEAGLRKASVVRSKIFTIESSFIIGQVGVLENSDREKVKIQIKNALGCLS